MSYLAIFKRIIPFFLTFAAGLLIASIFVPITAPTFRSMERSQKWREYKNLRTENQDLRRDNCRLKKEIEQLRREAQLNMTEFVPAIDVDIPPPPPMPARPNHRHFDR